MEEKTGARVHRLTLTDRHGGVVTGVANILFFDDNQIEMDTDMGILTIKGRKMDIRDLHTDRGEMVFEGEVDSMTYSSNESLRKSGESLFSRMFR